MARFHARERALLMTAFLAVGSSFANPPTIMSQPRDVTVGAGVPARLSISASGTLSRSTSVQWLREGEPVLNATNSSFVITNTTFADTAAYSAIVSNSFGTNLSAPATVKVVPPVRLKRRSSVTTPTGGEIPWAWWVRVQNGLAYVADSRLQIYDVSNPDSPVHLSSWGTSESRIAALYVTTNRVYALDEGFLHIIDVSNPQAPVAVEGSQPFRMLGAPGGLHDLVVHNGLAYIASSRSFIICDVSDPSRPNVLAEIQNLAGYTVAARDNAVYLGGQNAGVPIINVSNPSLPSSTNMGEMDFVDSVAISGQRLYFAGSALGVIDISEPLNPRLMATPRRTDLFATQGMNARGSFIFTGNKDGAIGNPANKPILSVFDAENPANLIELARVRTTNTVESVDIIGNLIYLTQGKQLEIYEWEPATNAPVVLQPISQILARNDVPAKLQVYASGGEELQYQWLKGETELAGETNRTLRFPNATEEVFGAYSVRISNSFGTITNTGSLQRTDWDAFTPTIRTGGADGPRLSYAVPSGLQARLEASSNLVTWEELIVNEFGGGTVTNLLDSPGRGASSRFYRLQYGVE